MASPEFDVCIIGYGPVGASLANLLGLSGLKTVVLEREPSVYHLPRAVALDGEGMRLFQTMGLADELLPRLDVSRNIRHVSADGKLLLLITRSGKGPRAGTTPIVFISRNSRRFCARRVALPVGRCAAALRSLRARRSATTTSGSATKISRRARLRR